MAGQLRRGLVAALTLHLACACQLPRAFGGVMPITGVYAGISPPAGAGSLPFTFKFTQGTVTGPLGLRGFSVNNLTVTITDVHHATLSSPFIVTAPGGAGTASFTLDNPAALSFAAPSSGTLTAVSHLQSNSIHGVDLSGLALGGLSVMFTGIEVSPTGVTYPVPPGATVTATFELAPSATTSITGVIPEPASLALWALPGLAWLARLGRRRLSPARPTPG
jgi:hypothetical protein